MQWESVTHPSWVLRGRSPAAHSIPLSCIPLTGAGCQSPPPSPQLCSAAGAPPGGCRDHSLSRVDSLIEPFEVTYAPRWLALPHRCHSIPQGPLLSPHPLPSPFPKWGFTVPAAPARMRAARASAHGLDGSVLRPLSLVAWARIPPCGLGRLRAAFAAAGARPIGCTQASFRRIQQLLQPRPPSSWADGPGRGPRPSGVSVPIGVG